MERFFYQLDRHILLNKRLESRGFTLRNVLAGISFTQSLSLYSYVRGEPKELEDVLYDLEIGLF